MFWFSMGFPNSAIFYIIMIHSLLPWESCSVEILERIFPCRNLTKAYILLLLYHKNLHRSGALGTNIVSTWTCHMATKLFKFRNSEMFPHGIILRNTFISCIKSLHVWFIECIWRFQIWFENRICFLKALNIQNIWFLQVITDIKIAEHLPTFNSLRAIYYYYYCYCPVP